MLLASICCLVKGENRIGDQLAGKGSGPTELKLGDEFLSTVSRDDEDRDVSYPVKVKILDITLP